MKKSVEKRLEKSYWGESNCKTLENLLVMARTPGMKQMVKAERLEKDSLQSIFGRAGHTGERATA